ncbi:membrane protein [Streptomyces roseus]|uniref:Membrane protein n=1 Tax=Streptomyces roseus TaxID=66430 RepID=A0A0J6XX67_9ACTN|nr:membrane protein [Streptomyces roseus]KMO99353.1 membrane protein [Streptomyces roseus]
MSEQQPNPYSGDNGAPGGPGYGYPQGYPATPGTPGYGYPAQPPAPGYGYPQDTPPAPGYQPTMGGAGIPAPGQPPIMPPGQPQAFGGGSGFALGDITIAGDQIMTPSGPMPLRGAMWNASDLSRTETKIPAHAIVLAVIFFLFCLLGLLFLLMKEKTTTGYIQVTVTSGGRHHSTMIPAVDASTYHWVMNQINYARSLSI